VRIAFLTPEYVTESNFDGGLAGYLSRAANGLLAAGHSVEVIVASDRDETFVEHSVVVTRVRPSDRQAAEMERWASRVTRRRWCYTAQILAASVALRRAFWKRHHAAAFDVVQIPDFAATGLALLLAGAPVPVVMRLSSDERLWRQAYGRPATADALMAERLSRWMRGRCRALYAPSRFLADYLRRQEGRAVDVVEPPFALPPIGAIDAPPICRAHPYLLFHGTIGRLKGTAVLAEALAIALAEQPDMHMVLAGKDVGLFGVSDSAVEHIRQRAGAHADRVHDLGRLSRQELFRVIASARGCVLPSLVDNLPNACLEAMALHRVVIGTNGASFDQLIDHERSGFLVPAGAAEPLANAMLRVWRASDAERSAIGAAAAARIDELAPRRAVPALERYLLAVIERARPGNGARPISEAVSHA
jgi:glycosyltransferase involved in cell wall biosynthesis